MRCVSCDLEVRREVPGKQRKAEEADVRDDADQGRDERGEGDDPDEDEGMEVRRARVVGRVLRYMEMLSGRALVGEPPDEDELIRRLERCADIVSKLGSIRM